MPYAVRDVDMCITNTPAYRYLSIVNSFVKKNRPLLQHLPESGVLHYNHGTLELAANIIQDQLLERCRQGDQAGYRLLYDRYSRAMYHTSLRIVNNTADAEDILQEAFTDAFRWLGTFQNRSSFGAWLKRIVVNKSINRIKRKKMSFIELTETRMESVADEEVISESEMALRVEEVKNAIRALPDGYRTVLSLHLLEDYPHADIAEMLNISPVTVRTQYIRAKNRLLAIIRENNALTNKLVANEK